MVCQQWGGISRPLAWAVLILNIAVGIIVIVCVTVTVQHRHRQDSAQDRHDRAIAWSESLEKQYLEVRNKEKDLPLALPLLGDQEQPGLEFLSLLKPIAVFSGLDFEGIPDAPTESATVRNWVNTDGADRKLLYNGMDYNVGSITVPASGLYRVYSHVKFFVGHKHGIGDRLTTFRHEIRHYSAADSTDSVLFEGRVTECRDGLLTAVDMEYPSDIGGVVQLGVGDALSVKVSNFTTLRNDQDWHYFGMYLVQ